MRVHVTEPPPTARFLCILLYCHVIFSTGFLTEYAISVLFAFTFELILVLFCS